MALGQYGDIDGKLLASHLSLQDAAARKLTLQDTSGVGKKIHGGALEPALVQELPGDAILSRKRPGRQHTVKLSALKARCANNCVAACHRQGFGDGQQRADIILTLSEPAWRSWGNDYKYLDEPRQVKLKHMNCARWGFHP